jgi:hypothetical protein
MYPRGRKCESNDESGSTSRFERQRPVLPLESHQVHSRIQDLPGWADCSDMNSKNESSKNSCPEPELTRNDPRFFRNLFDRGLEPAVAEQVRSYLLAAVSELDAREGRVDQRHLKILRRIKECKLTEMFLDARKIEIARDISTKLKPCSRCGTKVEFHFVSNPEESVFRGYVLCSGCRSTANICGSADEIVDKWNNHAPNAGREELASDGPSSDR